MLHLSQYEDVEANHDLAYYKLIFYSQLIVIQMVHYQIIPFAGPLFVVLLERLCCLELDHFLEANDENVGVCLLFAIGFILEENVVS